jgi:hypothetical protein
VRQTDYFNVVRDEFIDGRISRRRRGRPPETAGFGEHRASAADRPRERLGFNQADMSEATTKQSSLAATTSDDERKRSTDRVGELAEPLYVPVDALAAPAAGGELERENLDFRPLGDQFGPSTIVVISAAVYVKCGG